MTRDDPQLEIHMPSEDRCFGLDSFTLGRCPCGGAPLMERRVTDGVAAYRVRCAVQFSNEGIPVAIKSEACDKSQPTPWLPSSQKAIQHWKLVAALSRP